MPSGKKPLTDTLTEEELNALEEKYKTCTCIADILPVTWYSYPCMSKYFGARIGYKKTTQKYIPIKKSDINYRWWEEDAKITKEHKEKIASFQILEYKPYW